MSERFDIVMSRALSPDALRTALGSMQPETLRVEVAHDTDRLARDWAASRRRGR